MDSKKIHYFKRNSKKNLKYFMYLCYVCQIYVSVLKTVANTFRFSEEPCTSGTTPIVSHCPTIVGEGSRVGVNVMQQMKKSNSQNSTSSEEDSIAAHPCH